MVEPAPSTSGLPYGPFTIGIRRFLQQFARLTPAAEEGIVATYTTAGATQLYQAAERVLAGAIARSGRERERDALGGPLLQLVRSNRGESVEFQTTGTPLRPIAEPALAALLAVMMQDVLPDETVRLLYAPFEPAIPRQSLR